MRSAGLALVVVAACSFEHGRIPIDGSAAGDAKVSVTADAIVDAPDAALTCMQTYTIVSGTSRYRVGTGDWYAAEAACEADGAHLVVIDDATENAAVLALQPAGEILLGMSDHTVEGTFRWVTGAAVTGYTNWIFLEPNNTALAEDCGSMKAGGQWNDLACTIATTYVCECDGIALPATPTWCATGTDTSCNTCTDNCTTSGTSCHVQQICF